MGGSENAFQRRRTFLSIVTVLFVISILMMLVARSESEAFAKPRAAIDNITAPIINVMNMPIRGAETMVSNFKARSETYDENERLRAEIVRLRDVEIRAQALQAKINQFEEILKTDIVDDIPTLKIPARAVAETNGPFVRSALLNVGRNDGVKKGHAVMTTDGLYGHIVRVGNGSSRALLLNDLNSRIAVKSSRSEARAILIGSNSATPSLSFIGPEADWKAGDFVVSSGDEGVLPAGLPIGQAVKGASERAFNVTLHTDKRSVDWVWVYPFAPIEAPIETAAENQDAPTTEQTVTDADPNGSAASTGEQ